jgi:magnesium-transporting ATPase (P-type)
VILLRQFRSLVVLLLIGAAGVALAIGDVVDAGAIAGVLGINVALGFRDVLTIEAGQAVPADARLIEGTETGLSRRRWRANLRPFRSTPNRST